MNTYCVGKNNVLCRMFDPKRLKNKENPITVYSKPSYRAVTMVNIKVI